MYLGSALRFSWHLSLLPEHLQSFVHTRNWTRNRPLLSPVIASCHSDGDGGYDGVTSTSVCPRQSSITSNQYLPSATTLHWCSRGSMETFKGGVGGVHHSTGDSKTCSTCTPYNEYYHWSLGHLSRASPCLRTVGLQVPLRPCWGIMRTVGWTCQFHPVSFTCKKTCFLMEMMVYLNGLSQWVLGQLSHPDLEQMVADQRWNQHFPAASSLCLDGWC